MTCHRCSGHTDWVLCATHVTRTPCKGNTRKKHKKYTSCGGTGSAACLAMLHIAALCNLFLESPPKRHFFCIWKTWAAGLWVKISKEECDHLTKSKSREKEEGLPKTNVVAQQHERQNPPLPTPSNLFCPRPLMTLFTASVLFFFSCCVFVY